MNILRLEDKIKFKKFWIKSNFLFIKTFDGKIIKRSKNVYEQLAKASGKELGKYKILGDGEGVHWPLLDEDFPAALIAYPERFKR